MQESALDRANRLARAVDYETRRKAFVTSHEGANAALQEATALADGLQTHVGSDAARSLSIEHKRHGNLTLLARDNLFLSVNWNGRYSNTLDGSWLEIGLWDGHPHFPGAMLFFEPKSLKKRRITFDLSQAGHTEWVDGKGRRFVTVELADNTMIYFYDEISKRLRPKTGSGLAAVR